MHVNPRALLSIICYTVWCDLYLWLLYRGKEIPHSRVKSVRKWNTELDRFFNDLGKIQLPTNESTTVDTLVELFEEDLRRCLDKHAPLADKKIIPRRKFPWYNANIKAQKQRLRRKEGVWKIYKTADTLKALKIEKNRYKFMLKISIRDACTPQPG